MPLSDRLQARMTGSAWKCLLLEGVLQLLPGQPEAALGLLGPAFGLHGLVVGDVAETLLGRATDLFGLASCLVLVAHIALQIPLHCPRSRSVHNVNWSETPPRGFPG